MPRASSGLALALACLGLFGLAGEPCAGELQYSPSRCATDPGDTIYLALGEIVLRVPLDALTYILDLSQEEKARAPRVLKPDDPEGCSDHPVQAKAFTLRAPTSELLAHDGESDSRWPPFIVFRLIWVSPDYWGLQPSAEKRFARKCSAFGVWEELKNGLVACRTRSEKTPELDQTSAISYQARPEVYGAPFGRPFVVQCSHLLQIGMQDCEISYKLYPSVNFFRRFDLQRADVDEIVDVDRALRAWIKNARVADYPWPDVDAP